jgi:hypothetical protein
LEDTRVILEEHRLGDPLSGVRYFIVVERLLQGVEVDVHAARVADETHEIDRRS